MATDLRRNPDICGVIAPRSLVAATNWAEQYQIANSCIENWASRLAQGPDTATEVADGATAACMDSIDVTQALATRENIATDGKAELIRHFRNWALFIAVQNRAGNCGLPKS